MLRRRVTFHQSCLSAKQQQDLLCPARARRDNYSSRLNHLALRPFSPTAPCLVASLQVCRHLPTVKGCDIPGVSAFFTRGDNDGRGRSARGRWLVHAQEGQTVQGVLQASDAHKHTCTVFWVHSEVNIHLVLAQHVCPFFTFSVSV